jgi:hypothetical protein
MYDMSLFRSLVDFVSVEGSFEPVFGCLSIGLILSL